MLVGHNNAIVPHCYNYLHVVIAWHGLLHTIINGYACPITLYSSMVSPMQHAGMLGV